MNYTIYETLMQEIFALKDKLHVLYKNVKIFYILLQHRIRVV